MSSPPVPQLGLALRRAHHAFRQVLEADLRHLQLSLPAAGVLLALSQEDGLSSALLARREGVTAQTMNQLLLGLAEHGLVERRPHATHGRIITMHLTRNGRGVLADALAAAANVEARMLGGLSAAERRRLLRDLERCADALTAD